MELQENEAAKRELIKSRHQKKVNEMQFKNEKDDA